MNDPKKRPKVKYRNYPLIFAKIAGNLHRFFNRNTAIEDTHFVCRRVIANDKIINYEVAYLEEITAPLRKDARILISESDGMNGIPSAAKKRRLAIENDRKNKIIAIDSQLRSSLVQFEESIADSSKLYISQIRVFSAAARKPFDKAFYEQLLSAQESRSYRKYVELNAETDSRISVLANRYTTIKEGA